MNSLENQTLNIPVDREHGGLRLAVIVTFAAAWVILFFVLSALITNEGFSLLAVILGFVGAYGVTAAVEHMLKGRWTSGRFVQVDRNGVRTMSRGKVQQEILSEDPANTLLWTFQIARRARVPKGWSMAACAIIYEDTFLSVYTFMSPKQVERFPYAGAFTRLISERKGMKDREDLRLAGEQRRVRDAESQRWLNGAEMTPEDFETFLVRLSTQFPEWLRLN